MMAAVFWPATYQCEPLLHEVDAQHGLQRKRRAALLDFGRVRHHQFHQRRPRRYALHLRLELALVLGAQVKVEMGLPYAEMLASAERADYTVVH